MLGGDPQHTGPRQAGVVPQIALIAVVGEGMAKTIGIAARVDLPPYATPP